MKQPTKEVLLAIRNLKQTHDFKLFTQWLNDSYVEAFRVSAIVPRTLDQAIQKIGSSGQFSELFQLVDCIKTAEETLAVIRKGEDSGKS